MSLIASENSKRQLPPEGSHVARCVRVIDLGTQRTDYGDSVEMKHKCQIAWELPEKKAVFKEDRGEEPFLASREYNVSMYDGANLRHDIESWLGRQLSKQERKSFNVCDMLGRACLVTIIPAGLQKVTAQVQMSRSAPQTVADN